jgi:hypothetical protein
VRRRSSLLAIVVLALCVTGCGGGGGSTRTAVTRLPSPPERRAGLEVIARRVMEERGAPASKIRCVEQTIAATGLGQLMKEEETLRYTSSETPLEFIASFGERCGGEPDRAEQERVRAREVRRIAKRCKLRPTPDNCELP